jgi:hypothetical protein
VCSRNFATPWGWLYVFCTEQLRIIELLCATNVVPDFLAKVVRWSDCRASVAGRVGREQPCPAIYQIDWVATREGLGLFVPLYSFLMLAFFNPPLPLKNKTSVRIILWKVVLVLLAVSLTMAIHLLNKEVRF